MGKARELFDQVLNLNPENHDAYFGMVLANMQFSNIEAFRAAYIDRLTPDSIELKRARQYADESDTAWWAALDKERAAQDERKRIEKELQRQEEERKQQEEEQKRQEEEWNRQKEAMDRHWREFERKEKKKRRIIIAVITTLIVLIGAIVLGKVIIPNIQYNKVVKLYEAGEYEDAIEVFMSLNGFKNSEHQMDKCYIELFGEKNYYFVKNAKVGDICKFGTYEQNNNKSDGQEEIEWIVLEKDDLSLLLVSRYVLDCKRYNEVRTEVTWETCSLRKWLNSNFINTAFSEEELRLIPTVIVPAPYKSYNETQDKVFLLSLQEAHKYFASDKDRKCVPTDYAVAQGVDAPGDYKLDGEATCHWLLRNSTYYGPYEVDEVCRNGSCGKGHGHRVDFDGDGVRPALWIKLEP